MTTKENEIQRLREEHGGWEGLARALYEQSPKRRRKPGPKYGKSTYDLDWFGKIRDLVKAEKKALVKNRYKNPTDSHALKNILGRKPTINNKTFGPQNLSVCKCKYATHQKSEAEARKRLSGRSNMLSHLLDHPDPT